MSDRIRVLLVDDQELIRYGLRLVIDAKPDLQVVGEASDGDEAVEAAVRLLPDVILMDVRMRNMNGIDATREIIRVRPQSRVLVLTTYDNDDFAFGALQAGTAGFLLKNAHPDELTAAIRTVYAGDAVVSPRVTAKLIELAVDQLAAPTSPAPAAAEALHVLSDREREVFALVAQGLSNREIAGALFVSESTVKAHFGRILSKLQLASRVQAVVLAYEIGVVGR
ncbi:response regulator [Leucobacter sp. W1478]|uniref:response regulator n=1 Tax=Leucobacter sp. W1478 TaxID=3439065 RepID=UPI003F2E1A70